VGEGFPLAPACRRRRHFAGLGRRLLSLDSGFVDFQVRFSSAYFGAIGSFPFLILRGPVLNHVVIYSFASFAVPLG
jgi:hypothetical protein